MADIYDYETGDVITQGIQGSTICNAAIHWARNIAADRGEPVVLDDDDGSWLVQPDGSCQEFEWPLDD